MTELRFEGRVAIVTGAGRGVGRCHALLLAARGAKVVVADLGGELDGTGESSAPAELVVKEIEAEGGEAVAAFASVAEEAGADTIVQTAIDSFGRLDIVVNNAGIAAPESFETHTMDKFRLMNAVHYLGTVYVTKAAYPHLEAAGDGRIVNTCSEAVLGMVPKATSYAGGKGGVLGFTKALALDAMRHGILVNAVAPRAGTRLSGPDIMAATYDQPAELFTGLSDQFPPEQVSPVMAYLAHESCTLNGEIIVAGGGQAMRLALFETQGIQSEDMTPEYVAENVDRLLDLTDANLIEVQVLMGDH